MRIQTIETFCARIPLKQERRMVSALGRHDHSDFVLVRLTTDDGLIGAGEATVTPRWSGETVWGAAAMIDRLFAPALTGMNCDDLDSIEQRMDQLAIGNWFAKAAIEMACWDVLGQAAGKPVFELLGGAVRPLQIRNRFSLGAYEPDVAAERAARLTEAGFQTIKVKVGGKPGDDLERVRAVRRAIGAECQLTIDANGGWNFTQAHCFLKEAEDLDIAWVEQPLPRGDYTETKKLKERHSIKVLADESCFDEVQMRELLIHECCDAVTLYPGKHGGLRKARSLAALAAKSGIPCTIGSNLEWDVGAATMMQFIVSTKNVMIEAIPGDCLGPTYHEFSIVRNPLEIDGPMTTLPDSPGLGVEVDWELVERHRLI
ncbi:MAG: muconate cycloisomerase [Planctomycetaceae bacterium]|nr:muconate cycloisomerase [Planctomycetaceae bacterium]